MDKEFQTSQWTQKEVLIMTQDILNQGKKIYLPSANWSGLDLRGISLKNANLRFANLSNANLEYADLENANLRYANLKGARLKNAKLTSTDLSEANCEGAEFDGATGLGLRFCQKWKIPNETLEQVVSLNAYQQRKDTK